MSLIGPWNILAGASGAGDYTIDQSCRFDGTSARLNKTFSSGGNEKTWTLSWWFKRCGNFGASSYMFNTGPDANSLQIYFESANKFRILVQTGGGVVCQLLTNQVIRDVAAWYHVCIIADTPQVTNSNRLKLFINGEQVTSFETETYPAQDDDLEIFTTQAGSGGHAIGNRTSDYYFNGYLAEFYAIDGTAYAASDFGETNVDTNQWVPIKFAGAFGSEGFYLKFEDSADFGNDSSGNGNDFTSTGLAATDQMKDTPSNNFATMNPLVTLSSYALTLTEGNLKNTNTANAYRTTFGTMGMASGKWYFESYINRNAGWVQTGVIGSDVDLGALVSYYIGSKALGWGYNTNGQVYNNNSGAAYGDSYTAADIIGIAIDLDNNKLYFAKNNTWQDSGDPTSGATGTGALSITPQDEYFFAQSPYNVDATINFGQDSSFAGAVTAQGNQDGNSVGDFYYTPPAGYLALCTSNLSDPAIALPADYFNTKLYTGDGATTLAVTGVGFQPDFTWIKNRSATDKHVLVDAVRGANNYLSSDSTAAQVDDSTFVASLDSDGFTVGDDVVVNTNTENYVSWNWLAADTFDPTTDGDIAVASGRRNVTAGFSIVKYTGENAVKTIGHGLSTAPKLIIVKNLGVLQWPTYYQRADGTDGVIWLDQDGNGEAAGTAYWNDTNPTASVFTVGDSANTGGLTTPDYIAYCFAEVEGYSKIGLYTGNGNADGAFIYTGFRPAYIMVKRTDDDNDWRIFDDKRDPHNVNYHRLNANLNYAEGTEIWNYNDFVSNGFKWRVSDGGYNASGGTYLYIAFADYPFKTTNAR